MIFARIALISVMLSGLVSRALAGPEDDLAARQALAAPDATGRAIAAGCIPAPYPTAPSGTSSAQSSVEDGYFPGAKVALTLWRLPCAHDPRQSVVLLRVTGVARGGSSGSIDPFICDINFQVVQGGRSYGGLDLKSETGYLCGTFPVGTSKVFAIDQYASAIDKFDPQKALELRYRNGYPLVIGDYVPTLGKLDMAVDFFGAGTGRVTSSDGRIDCRPGNAGICKTQYDEMSSVTLTAAADSGSRFTGWVQSACGTTAATTTVLIRAATGCTAKFEQLPVEPQTGFWYDPARSGVGFAVERNGARMLLSAYMYRGLGDGSPFWFNAVGTYSVRTFTGKIEQFFGGPQLGADKGYGISVMPGGTLTLTFSTPTTASIRWDGLSTPITLVRYQFADHAPGLAAAAGDGGNPSSMASANRAASSLAAGLAASRVIVTMRQDGDARRRAGAVQGRMAMLGASRLHVLASTAQFIAEVPSAALEALRRDPDVATVEADRLMSFSLRQSGPLVQADQMRAAGAIGSGRAVAVIDSGVDPSHSFVAGRVVAEACFSTNLVGTAARAISACPNGASSQIGPGTAWPCNAQGCEHGTHVAGIAAGSGGDIYGMAPAALIVAVQIATTVEAAVCQPRRCSLIFMSDVLRALDWVNQQAIPLGIAAVNMSLGSESLYSGYCDYSSFKPVIDALRAKNIPTVVASGNDGSTWRVAEPACVSTAIAVGATTKAGAVSSFSNVWDKPILMAPGSGIVSSVPGGGFAAMDGTSMATPHVAGAFTALRALFPFASVTTMREKLLATGTRDSGGRGFYRINMRDAALAIDSTTRITPETGWWWTPGAGGRGFFIESQGDQIFMASYHYRPDGAADWAVGQGQVAFGGQIQFSLRRFAGGTSLDGEARGPAEAPGMGSVTLQFTDRRSGMILLPDGRRQSLARFAF